jgi:Domain of unknown function (DUF4159)
LRPAAFQLAADIFLYAVDKQNLRFKGQSYLVQPDPTAAVTRTIRIARLDYGPGWNPEPGGWRRLAAVMHNLDGVDLQARAVRLGDGSLNRGGYQAAEMTGTAALLLTATQRREIRAFVAAGGTLIVDAAGGSRPFAQSARRQLSEIFPAQAAQLQTPLPIGSPIYSADPRRIRGRDIHYRPFALAALGDLHRPRLRAISFNGRPAVYFSAEDLSVGLVGQPVDGIVGYTPELATRLMERMILSAGGK